MRDVLTPREFAAANVAALRQVWKGVRDGEVESLHQARVATRRLRSALEVVTGLDSDEARLCRSLGRKLGPVRELDVAHELMTGLDLRVPEGAAAIATYRRDIDGRRDAARRRLIKKLDDLDLRPLAQLNTRHRLATLQFWKDWRSDLAAVIVSQAAALRTAVDHTPKVYMPNRLHRVRIALKKLRYALEVAEAAGSVLEPLVLRDARRVQEVLGRMHDLHVTQRFANRVHVRGGRLAAEARLVDSVMSFECASLYEQYLARRERLTSIADYCGSRFALSTVARATRIAIRAVPTAGLVALPAAAVWRLVGDGSPSPATEP